MQRGSQNVRNARISIRGEDEGWGDRPVTIKALIKLLQNEICQAYVSIAKQQ